MGEKVTELSKTLFGEATWPIVSKKFDNLNPIPDHLHWTKWEVYDINSFDNPGVSASHYHTTAMGLYSFVTKDQFLDCMKRFGQGEYNGIRHLAPRGSGLPDRSSARTEERDGPPFTAVVVPSSRPVSPGF